MSYNSSPNPYLSLDLIHANHLPQLHEPQVPEWLGEDVSELSADLDELDDDLPSIDTVPEEVELNVDVLAPVVEDRVLGEGDGGLIVHHQGWLI